MEIVDQRESLARLARERGVGYAALSRLIGRNAAYIQQFIKRGSPKKLEEDDRRILASFFGVAESFIGGPVDRHGVFKRSSSAEASGGLIAVPRLDIGASAGPGAYHDGENALSPIGFEEKWLRQIASGKPGDLSLIHVQGDSMTPALCDGDDILVDAGDGPARLRDGIYVLRRDDALLVKRVSPNPASRRVSIKSDNKNYPSWPDCRLGDIDIIGRVVWVGRRLS